MKVTALVTSLAIVGTESFAPGAGNARASTALDAERGVTSRAGFLQQSVASAVATLAILPGNANAAKYGGFGAGSPEVLDPKDAIFDEDALRSSSVQKGISAVRGYRQSVIDMKNILAKDNQADIGPKIRKDFDFSVIRTDLNAINAALDEDTQRGTDRLVRAILQDITELEVSQKQKPGVPRSETRLENVNKKLQKLERSFNDYLAFAPTRAPPPAPAPAPPAPEPTTETL